MRLILFGEDSLRRAVREFLAHYHQERNHQGVDNHILKPGEEVGGREGRLACRQRLGGLLRYYIAKLLEPPPPTLSRPMPLLPARSPALLRFSPSVGRDLTTRDSKSS